MKKINLFIVVFSTCFLLFSCSVNKLAMNMVADALTGDAGAEVFTGDSDPQLVGDALPFAIKMYEALLTQNPEHQGLLLTTGSLFIMYANAFIQGPAEMLPSSEWEKREAALMRSKQLYLRGSKILFDALELKYRGFRNASADDGTLNAILQKCRKEDAALLYWAVAGSLSAYSIDLLDFELSSQIPKWRAMIYRAYELDPNFNISALDEFFILFYASMPESMGGDLEKAKYHFERALEKTGGNSVSAYVSYAQFICVPAQDYDTYKDYLERALLINPDANISTRLVNIIAQQRARWLLDNAWTFFSFLPFPDDF